MAEKKFASLRKRLDQLGYRQTFDIDSLPLVEKLFSDLIHTTESLKNQKAKILENEHSGAITDVSAPYRHENAKLIKQNNDLHAEIVQLQSKLDKQAQDYKALRHSLEHENLDLKFLNSQYVYKMRTLEEESKQKSNKLHELHSKSSQAVVETPAGRRKQSSYRRQRMDIGGMLDPHKSASSPDHYDVAKTDVYVADLLEVADTNLQEVKRDFHALKTENEQLERQNVLLKNQIESQEREVKRLARLLDGGRPIDAITFEMKNSSSRKVQSHLNLQVDLLQQQNNDLREQVSLVKSELAKVTSLSHDLQYRNDELCQELAQLEKIFQSAQTERNKLGAQLIEYEADKEADFLARKQIVVNLEAEIEQLKEERNAALKESQDLLQLLGVSEKERKDLTMGLGSRDRNKKALLKNSLLTVPENELIKNIENFKVSEGIVSKKLKHSNAVVKLKQERDALQAILEKFEKHLKMIQENVVRLASERDNIQLLYEQTIQEKRALSEKDRAGSSAQLASSGLQISENGKEERLSSVQTAESMQRLQTEILNLQHQSRKLRKQSQMQIQEFQQIIVELEHDKSELCLEITSRKHQLKTLQSEFDASASALRVAKEELREKDMSISKLKTLIAEADKSIIDMRQKLLEKAVTEEAAGTEKRSIQGHLESIQSELQKKISELVHLQKVVADLDKEKDALEAVVDKKSEHIVDLQQLHLEMDREMTEIRSNVVDLDAQVSNKDERIKALEQEGSLIKDQLRILRDELASAAQARDAVFMKNKQLHNDLISMTVENQAVHKDLNDALGDRNRLKIQVEEYASQVARVEELLSIKDQEKDNLLMQFQTLSTHTELLQANATQTAHQASSYQQEMLQYEEEHNQLKERCAALERELEQRRIIEASYESTIAGFNERQKHADDLFAIARSEKDAVIQDLYAVREVCVKLDKTREELTAKLAASATDCEKLKEQLEEAKHEIDFLRTSVNHDKRQINSLENIIASGREQQFRERRLQDDSMAELNELRGNLAACEKERDRKGAEAAFVRQNNMALQEEVANLRKQLTSEKYERERLNIEFAQRLRSLGGNETKTQTLSAEHIASPSDGATDTTRAINRVQSPRSASSQTPLPSSMLSSTTVSFIEGSCSDGDNIQ